MNTTKDRNKKTGWFSKRITMIKGIFSDMLLNSYRRKETIIMNAEIKDATHVMLTALSRGFAAAGGVLDVNDKAQQRRIVSSLGHMSGILTNSSTLFANPAVDSHLRAAMEDIWASCQRSTRDTLAIIMATSKELSSLGEPMNSCVERIVDHGKALTLELGDMKDHVKLAVDRVEDLATTDARQSLSKAIQAYVTKIKTAMSDNEVELDVEALALKDIERAIKRAKLDGVFK